MTSQRMADGGGAAVTLASVECLARPTLIRRTHCIGLVRG
jgi:hypothetical protein